MLFAPSVHFHVFLAHFDETDWQAHLSIALKDLADVELLVEMLLVIGINLED